MEQKQPFTVEVTRGGMAESRHYGAAIIVDAKGKVLHSWGDTDQLIYPRSAIKPLQSLALLESGAADHYELSDAEVALASSSHSSEPLHVSAVTAWLDRIGLAAEDLECIGHLPINEQAVHDMIRSGEKVTNIHNNCSGKHTGFLSTALHLGEDTKGYIEAGHPVQERLLKILSEMGDCDLSGTPRGIDGCGIPVIGMPLSAMALAMARMADPEGLDSKRASAAKRIVPSMATHPVHVAGTGRFDTVAMTAARGRFTVKTGAEAVHAGIIPELGVGIALKIEDGNKRGSDVAIANILDLLGVLDDTAREGLKDFLDTPITNAAGALAGSVRMQEGWAG